MKNNFERKFEKFAIENLMTYIVFISFGVFAIDFLNIIPGFMYYLYFIPELFLAGQFWRIITFIFIPPSASFIFIVFVLYFYYTIGISLEHEWGTAKFNIYYLLGTAGAVIASFLTDTPATSTYLNLSLFLAFALLYPDYQILLFGILPIKVRYLSYVNWIVFGITIVFGDMSTKVFAAMSLLNFFAFFYKDFTSYVKLKRQVYRNRKRFHGEIRKFKKRN